MKFDDLDKKVTAIRRRIHVDLNLPMKDEYSTFVQDFV